MGRRSRHTTNSKDFERLYLESYPIVYNYVRWRMNGDAEAEDVVAEAYLKAARSFDRFDPHRAKFSTWVTRIALNCMASHYRKAHAVLTLDAVPESAASVPSEDDALADRELALQLLQALTAEERELVLLKYRDGMRNVDIAEQLHMNASTVSTKLFNAMKKMRVQADSTAL